MNRPGYIDVDKLQAETSLEAAAKCGVSLDVRGTGPEVRIDCPFGCPGDHHGRRELAINTDNPQKIFMCHAYECGFRGNLLTLMHGWLTGQKPAGGKLKGDEFQRVKRALAGSGEPAASRQAPKQPAAASEAAASPPQANVPLIDSADERVRELHNIDEKFVTAVADMNPAAPSYVRRHPCLTPESMQKWRCGYQQSYLSQVRAHFGPKTFDTVIPDLAQFERSVTDAVLITRHAPASSAARIAREFFDETRRRCCAELNAVAFASCNT